MEIAKFVILKSSGVTQIWLLCSNKHIIMYFSSFLYHKTYCEHIYIDLSGLLNVQLSPSGVCAINGLLYVIGGDDGSCNLSSVEFYNPATDKWSLIPTNMSNGRSYAGKSDNRAQTTFLPLTEKYSSPVHAAVSLTQSFVFSLLQESQ